MKKYYCNPLNLEYRYQFTKRGYAGQYAPDYDIYREAADPSLIKFRSLYYLFPSMTAGFYTSDDLHTWEFHDFLGEMPIYDYAPDVEVIGDYLYFSASRRGEPCAFYRTKDPLKEPFEKIEGTFEFWDPALFRDDDGRLYFYWGCTNTNPIYGVELQPETMVPLTEPQPMFFYDIESHGYERVGNDHIPPRTPEQTNAMVESMLARAGKMKAFSGERTEEELRAYFEVMFGNYPYIEGPWMTKHEGKYYLQYAITGTQYNVYGDGVYVSDSPLGPFTLARNNPYSYKPGGFMNGAGHGSTLVDSYDNVWHISTMQISRNHDFERRLGLWKAGFDEDGELFCDQRYGDWPIAMDSKPFDNPEWMLLSYGKKVTASCGSHPEAVADESCHTWWKAGISKDAWVEMDLERVMDIHAIQINFMDDHIQTGEPAPDQVHVGLTEMRYIDTRRKYTRWLLEGSSDGRDYFIIEDKRNAETDLPHDLIVREDGFAARFLKLTVTELPYEEEICVSGLRAFGLGGETLPAQVNDFDVKRLSSLDMQVSWMDIK